MLVCQRANREGESAAALGMSSECFGGNGGGSLVAADPARHDVAGISELRRVSEVVRRDCDEYIGGSSEEADRSWNYHHPTRSKGRPKTELRAHRQGHRSRAGAHGNGAMGRAARRNGKSTAGPDHAKRQGAISGGHPATLGRLNQLAGAALRDHSWRSAVMGSTRVARRAGT